MHTDTDIDLRTVLGATRPEDKLEDGQILVLASRTSVVIRTKEGKGYFILGGELKCKIDREGRLLSRRNVSTRTKSWCRDVWDGLVAGYDWDKDSIIIGKGI